MLETSKPEALLISFRQRLIVRFLLALLIDLIILNLFVEYLDSMVIDSFSISLLTALVLQIMLRITMAIEEKAGKFIETKKGTGKGAKALRLFVAWAILFGSKFIILWVVDLKFGDRVEFESIIPFILMLFSMIIIEALFTILIKIAWLKSAKQNTV